MDVVSTFDVDDVLVVVVAFIVVVVVVVSIVIVRLMIMSMKIGTEPRKRRWRGHSFHISICDCCGVLVLSIFRLISLDK